MAGAVMPVRRRFRLAYVLLALALAAAAAGLALLLANPVEGGRAWSSWRPEGHGLAAAEQIAEEVGARYRLASGKQIVGVLAQPPQIAQNVPLSAVAIASAEPDQRQEDIKVFRTGGTVLYIVCGIGGEQCAIPEGAPSEERMMLLRREALELALHTFKYDGDKDAVLAILPPPSGEAPANAVYFRREDFRQELSRPLDDTLLSFERITPAELTDGESRTVRQLTLPDAVHERYSGLYGFQFQQAPDGSAYVALSPVS